MKVIVIGASGTIGKPVADALAARHEVIRVSRTGGDFQADLSDADSLRRLFEKFAPFDAVVSAAGAARFAPLSALSDDDFAFSLANKLMGQVNVVRLGSAPGLIRDGGSFTLTSGILAADPMPGSGAISLVNAGLEGFARAAALELRERGVRVNVVSPPWVSETLEAMGKDGGGGTPAEVVALAYVEAVEGHRTGNVFDARQFLPRPGEGNTS